MTMPRTPDQLRRMAAELRADAAATRKRLPTARKTDLDSMTSRIYLLERRAQHFDAAAERAQERAK